MMKSILPFLFSILFGLSSNVFAQNKMEVIKTITVKAKKIDTDRLGNLYVLNNQSVLKYNNKGDSVAIFNSNRYGEIYTIDTSDPYKILVFFKNFSVLLVLDNYLSPISKAINFQDIGFDRVTAVCHAAERGYWLFDQINQKLYRIDENGEKTQESFNFAQWFGHNINPTALYFANNQLYLNDPKYGVFVLDQFASFQNKIALKNIREIQITTGAINYSKNGTFCEYQLRDFDTKCEILAFPKTIQARKEKNRFYTFDGDIIRIYKSN